MTLGDRRELRSRAGVSKGECISVGVGAGCVCDNLSSFDSSKGEKGVYVYVDSGHCLSGRRSECVPDPLGHSFLDRDQR